MSDRFTHVRAHFRQLPGSSKEPNSNIFWLVLLVIVLLLAAGPFRPHRRFIAPPPFQVAPGPPQIAPVAPLAPSAERVPPEAQEIDEPQLTQGKIVVLLMAGGSKNIRNANGLQVMDFESDHPVSVVAGDCDVKFASQGTCHNLSSEIHITDDQDFDSGISTTVIITGR